MVGLCYTRRSDYHKLKKALPSIGNWQETCIKHDESVANIRTSGLAIPEHYRLDPHNYSVVCYVQYLQLPRYRSGKLAWAFESIGAVVSVSGWYTTWVEGWCYFHRLVRPRPDKYHTRQQHTLSHSHADECANLGSCTHLPIGTCYPRQAAAR